MEDERRHCDRRAVTTLLYDGFLVREFSRPASYCVTTPGTPVLGSVARFWGARCHQPSSPTATDNSDDDDGGDCGGAGGHERESSEGVCRSPHSREGGPDDPSLRCHSLRKSTPASRA